MNIGFIGTGVMGRSMAGHLMAAGHIVDASEGEVVGETPTAGYRRGFKMGNNRSYSDYRVSQIPRKTN